MAKRKKLPYRKVRVRVKGKIRIRYYSNLTRRWISKNDISKNPRVQGFREAFPGRSEKTRRRIRKTIAEYRRVGFNPIEASPSLGRYFSYLRKKKPQIYQQVYNEVAGELEKTGSVYVGEIQADAESRHSSFQKSGKRGRRKSGKISRAKKGKRR